MNIIAPTYETYLLLKYQNEMGVIFKGVIHVVNTLGDYNSIYGTNVFFWGGGGCPTLNYKCGGIFWKEENVSPISLQ